MNNPDTDCRKCGAPMKPLGPPQRGAEWVDRLMVITGYRCDCGHWNNLKPKKKKGG